ncbi:MAG: hypothetical protein LBR16_02700 [Treponema sp.]|jgi:hypothetical protein|nr:hypothetical protein [Treponema sp.]
MKDEKTLAYINMYGILGALQDLCAVAPDAARLAGLGDALKPVRVCLAVKNGPALTLVFGGGVCTAIEGAAPCDILLPFGTFAKFNGLIEGTVTPFPRKGFSKISFLTKNFTALTGLLETCLRPNPEALADETFFRASTTIMFFLIARTLVQIGNFDPVGRFTRSNLAPGTVVLSIADGDRPPLRAAVIAAEDGLRFSREIPQSPHAVMEFSSIRLARDLFDGKVSALGSVGQGLIRMTGNLGMLDNINRMLDRVAVYLA